jgi:hypothetical protein
MLIQPMLGISMGPLWMVAPSDFAFSADSLMPSTPMWEGQKLGLPGMEFKPSRERNDASAP